MAIRQFAAMNPSLGLAQTRKNLSKQEKEKIFLILNMLGEQFEAQLIQEVIYGRQG